MCGGVSGGYCEVCFCNLFMSKIIHIENEKMKEGRREWREGKRECIQQQMNYSKERQAEIIE